MSMDSVAEAIENSLQSPTELDRNGETANVVDALYAIARAIEHLAEAVDMAAGAQVAIAEEQINR